MEPKLKDCIIQISGHLASSWSKHIQTVCYKARRLLGYMFRTFSPHYSPDSTTRLLYKAQVLPILKYGSVVCDPHLKQILLPGLSSIPPWLLVSNFLHSPVIGHITNCYVATYKFLNGYSFCPSGLFTFHHNPNPRLYHSNYLVQPFAKTVSFFNSYFVSSVRLWNSLPNEVVLCNDISSFKSNVKSIYLSWSFYLLLILLSQLFLFEVLHISFAIGPCNVLTYNHCSI